MNWTEHIDVYCERTDPGLWSEPFNALTNLGFLLAAALLWRRAGRDAPSDLRLLIGLIAAVGIGSGVFHTVATRGTAILDIVFIALFVIAYHQRFQVRVLARSGPAAWAGVGVFVALAGGFVAATRLLPPLPLNGSEIYLPPFALLVACAVRARRRAPAAARWLATAAALFVVSLTCRAVDQLLCAAWPVGTHLGWHLVNAAMLYCCMAGLLAVPRYRPFG